MIRAILLTAVCLILTSANSAVAQKPFKNKIALAAKKSYEEAIAQAKKEYVAKLEIAIKDAGGAGAVDEVNKIAAEKKRIDGSDPITAFRRRMIGTRWADSPKAWVRFQSNNVARCHDGGLLRWYVTGNRTLVTQRADRPGIHVWHFAENLNKGKIIYFKLSGVRRNLRKLR